MHAISSYRCDRSINTHTHKQTNPQTGPITINCAAKLSAQCNYSFHKGDGVFAVRIILLTRCEKPAQQIDSRAAADLAHHVPGTAENIDAVNDLELSQEGAPGTRGANPP